MDIEYISKPITCAHCGKRAMSGFLIESKPYAIQCAADLCGLTLSTIKKLKGLVS